MIGVRVHDELIVPKSMAQAVRDTMESLLLPDDSINDVKIWKAIEQEDSQRIKPMYITSELFDETMDVIGWDMSEKPENVRWLKRNAPKQQISQPERVMYVEDSFTVRRAA